jgi:O-antigen/teichoic acid export membrane protein
MSSLRASQASLRTNTLWNLAGSVLPTVLALVLIPVLLKAAGPEVYGVYSLFLLITAYVPVLDLGVARACSLRISALGAEQWSDGADRVVATAWLTALGVALPLACVFLAAYESVRYLVSAPVDDLPMLLLLLVSVPVFITQAIMVAMLEGAGRFRHSNQFLVTGAAAALVLPTWVAISGGDTHGVICAALIGRLLPILVTMVFFRRTFLSRLSSRFARDIAAEMLAVGRWYTVSAVISQLISNADRFTIGALIGPAGVTHYGLPYQLSERGTMLASSVIGAATPTIVKADGVERTRLLAMLRRKIFMLTTPAYLVALVAGGWFLSVWITPEFSQATGYVLPIVLVGHWLNGLARIPYVDLLSKGKTDLIAKIHMWQAFPTLVAIAGLTYWAGIEGAAVAFTLRVAVDFFMLTRCAREQS